LNLPLPSWVSSLYGIRIPNDDIKLHVPAAVLTELHMNTAELIYGTLILSLFNNAPSATCIL